MHLTLSPGRTTRKAAHARTASQPSPYQHQHHPALARLDGGVRELRSWTVSSSGSVAADGSSGLALVEAVLAALGVVLELPHAVAALHGGEAAACDRALDGFLVLADAYGTFESALLALRESVVEARGGARRGDGATVVAALRAYRRTEKELCRLAAAMRQASRPAADATGNDVGYVVAEAAAAIAAASEAIFLGCAAMSPDMLSISKTASSKNWLSRLHVMPAAKKVLPETAMAAAAELERLEECFGELESESEKVFRRLLQSRVSLLNIHNPL
ncbi:hypothetical protein E2562_010675 [Oryza meyeriana var. granulata]|uniref:Uncharacterized protein n=1 Tax=Oryza meyeriana var. granulata TaxID=110450 RepID=A0A6G1EVW8_9ORYZ|nr:hypothetical protein E2562_010675 [Oryza meyeriana var. granulata]